MAILKYISDDICHPSGTSGLYCICDSSILCFQTVKIGGKIMEVRIRGNPGVAGSSFHHPVVDGSKPGSPLSSMIPAAIYSFYSFESLVHACWLGRAGGLRSGRGSPGACVPDDHCCRRYFRNLSHLRFLWFSISPERKRQEGQYEGKPRGLDDPIIKVGSRFVINIYSCSQDQGTRNQLDR